MRPKPPKERAARYRYLCATNIGSTVQLAECDLSWYTYPVLAAAVRMYKCLLVPRIGGVLQAPKARNTFPRFLPASC